MTQLTLQQANELIDATLKIARSKKMPPIAVAVLDAGAHLKAFQREDGVTFLRVQIAQAKAWGALAMGVNSDQIATRYLKDDQQKGFIHTLNSMTGGQLVPLPGGVLLHDLKGNLIGAVGAAGGESSDDEFCVKQAMQTLGFPA